MDGWNEYLLLHGKKVELMIPEDMYIEMLKYITEEQLITNFKNNLIDENYEKLVHIKRECENRNIKINII